MVSTKPKLRERSWRHAWPQREDDEREEVAHGHRAAACLVDERVRRAECHPIDMLLGLVGDAVTGDAEPVQVHEEEDRSGDVEEPVEPVDVLDERRVAEEEGLDCGLEEDAKTLLDGDELQGMLMCLQCDPGDCAAE